MGKYRVSHYIMKFLGHFWKFKHSADILRIDWQSIVLGFFSLLIKVLGTYIVSGNDFSLDWYDEKWEDRAIVACSCHLLNFEKKLVRHLAEIIIFGENRIKSIILNILCDYIIPFFLSLR